MNTKPYTTPLGHIPMWLIRDFGVKPEELEGVKLTEFDSSVAPAGTPYVCVVRFDLNNR